LPDPAPSALITLGNIRMIADKTHAATFGARALQRRARAPF
jgi:hypothetical protein